VFNSQVILGRCTLNEFIEMSHDRRMDRFHDVVSERRLVQLRFCLLLKLDPI
jgi:hypothetical protein